MLPVETVIGRSGLRVDADGVRVHVRLPWYRSLPLSTIEIASLAIDGEVIAPDAIRFELDGSQWTLDELADEVDSFWYVLDEGVLFVPGLALEAGSPHDVAVTITLYPPYIPGMQRANSQAERLVATEETPA